MSSAELYKLTNIPQNIQNELNVGAEVVVRADNNVMGGHFEMENKDGVTIGVDAVELCGKNIMMRRVLPQKETRQE